MRRQFEGDDAAQLKALIRAAETLESLHGDWRVPFGEVFRLQRPSHVADLVDLRFNDRKPSLPCTGGHGPMGVAFTQYYTPSIVAPLVISQRRRYGVAGVSYMAAWEFDPTGVRGASLVPFGTSGDPRSPHYLDQAPLVSTRRFKPERFTEQSVAEHAVRSYHPGDEAPADDRQATGQAGP
jgi:acyl-homoserine-lactone acylase